MIGFQEAAAIIAEAAAPLGTETVALARAAGRVLAAPVVARIAAPATDASMMDGYAVRSADLAGGPARLRVGQEIFPGTADAGVLAPGTCARIFTGAPLPRGGDRVVMQEVVEREGELARFAGGSGPSFVRAAGSDFRAGDILVEAGVKLGPRALVAAAACDLGDVVVRRRPRVALLATGDELLPPGGASARPGAVPDSISAGLAALVERWGGEVTSARLLPDRLDVLREAAAQALREADLLLVTGGASVGARDFAREMVDGLELRIAKVAMKPGKPVWFGAMGDHRVMGLPGNPTSALVTARLLAAPLIAGMGGHSPSSAWAWREMRLAERMAAVGDRETFARGWSEAGMVRLAGNQDSGAQRTLAACDLLVRLAAGSAPAAGDPVSVLGLDDAP